MGHLAYFDAFGAILQHPTEPQLRGHLRQTSVRSSERHSHGEVAARANTAEKNVIKMLIGHLAYSAHLMHLLQHSSVALN
jgi:hypothetical protein